MIKTKENDERIFTNSPSGGKMYKLLALVITLSTVSASAGESFKVPEFNRSLNKVASTAASNYTDYQAGVYVSSLTFRWRINPDWLWFVNSTGPRFAEIAQYYKYTDYNAYLGLWIYGTNEITTPLAEAQMNRDNLRSQPGYVALAECTPVNFCGISAYQNVATYTYNGTKTYSNYYFYQYGGRVFSYNLTTNYADWQANSAYYVSMVTGQCFGTNITPPAKLASNTNFFATISSPVNGFNWGIPEHWTYAQPELDAGTISIVQHYENPQVYSATIGLFIFNLPRSSYNFAYSIKDTTKTFSAWLRDTTISSKAAIYDSYTYYNGQVNNQFDCFFYSSLNKTFLFRLMAPVADYSINKLLYRQLTYNTSFQITSDTDPEATDLSIDSLQASQEGDSIAVSFKLSNIGDRLVPSIPVYKIGLYCNDSLVTTWSQSFDLGPQSFQRFSHSFFYSDISQVAIKALCDIDNVLAESEKANNLKVQNIQFTPPVKAIVSLLPIHTKSRIYQQGTNIVCSVNHNELPAQLSVFDMSGKLLYSHIILNSAPLVFSTEPFISNKATILHLQTTRKQLYQKLTILK